MNNVEDTSAPAEAPLHPLPLAYGYPFLTLLPRDPHYVFAQWEIPEPTRRGAWEQWREGRGDPDRFEAETVLRLFDLTTDLKQFVDFEVPVRQTMHIRTERPGAVLVARIGLRLLSSPNGQRSAAEGQTTFIPVATSNVVRLPPGHPAEPGEEGATWSVVFDPSYVFRAEPDFGRHRMAPAQTVSSDFALGQRTRPT